MLNFAELTEIMKQEGNHDLINLLSKILIGD